MKQIDIRKEFSARLSIYKQLRDEALFILNTELKNREIKFHNITSRIKEIDSLIDKIQRKKIENPFDELGDIVGIRVVCLFRSDIEKIGDIIREHFCVSSEDNKISGYEVSSFGYQSVHFIVTIRDDFVGLRYDTIKNIRFEIQARTLAMDAWASISHYLDYKSDKDVPSELRKDFYALSGLFYVADTHFELFYRESKKSRKNIEELFSNSQSDLDHEINFDTLKSYLEVKFPDRKRADASTLSSMVTSLLESGKNSINDIDKIIDKGLTAFLQYEKKNPPSHPDPEVTLVEYADAGLLKILLAIVDQKYAEENYSDPDIFNQYRKRLQ